MALSFKFQMLGEPGVNGGQSGDLFVIINVEEDSVFKRDGDDLHLELALVGSPVVGSTTIELQLFDRTVDMKLPAGTADGQRFRLQGCGMPNAVGGYGSLYVTIKLKSDETDNSNPSRSTDATSERKGQTNRGTSTGGADFHRLISSEDELAAAILEKQDANLRLIADIQLTNSLPMIKSSITLSGDGHSISGGNWQRIFYVDFGGCFRIDNLYLISGRGFSFGGAIKNYGRTDILGCVFSDNSARDRGGAIHNQGEIMVRNSAFKANTSGSGGAVYNSGMATITECEFIGNIAETSGGAIDNASKAPARITHCTFSNNIANEHTGGAIYNSGNAIARHNKFSRNKPNNCQGLRKRLWTWRP